MEGETPPAHCKVTRALMPAAQMRARLFLSTAACKDVNSKPSWSCSLRACCTICWLQQQSWFKSFRAPVHLQLLIRFSDVAYHTDPNSCTSTNDGVANCRLGSKENPPGWKRNSNSLLCDANALCSYTLKLQVPQKPKLIWLAAATVLPPSHWVFLPSFWASTQIPLSSIQQTQELVQERTQKHTKLGGGRTGLQQTLWNHNHSLRFHEQSKQHYQLTAA